MLPTQRRQVLQQRGIDGVAVAAQGMRCALQGRSVKQLVDLVGELDKQGVQFKSLTDAIDTGTPSGRFFFHVMASLAEMERELIIERTRAGLDVARQLGRKGGRKPKMTESTRVRQLRA